MSENNDKYFYATGRRKSAIAKVRLYENSKENGILINDKEYNKYFANSSILTKKVYSPLELFGLGEKFRISVKVSGGGPNGQAEAIRLGIARALLVFNEEYKKDLRASEYLTRDPRKVERKKPGLKKARRAPQWKKR